jgi:hypothetical protein
MTKHAEASRYANLAYPDVNMIPHIMQLSVIQNMPVGSLNVVIDVTIPIQGYGW